MVQYTISEITDIAKPLIRRPIAEPLVQFNNSANAFAITVVNGANSVPLDNIEAYFIRADNTTVMLTTECSASGNVATVIPSENCYAVPGPAILTVNNVGDDGITCIGIFECTVPRASTDSVVDPDEIIPSVENLIREIRDAAASIPEDYSELSQSVVDMEAEVSNLPIEVGSFDGSVQLKPYTNGYGVTYTQQAKGVGAFAEGANTLAVGGFSHCEGFRTFAFSGSHAEGSGELMFRVSVTTMGTATSTMFSYENLDSYSLHSTDIGKYLVIIDGTLTGSLAYKKITNINTDTHSITLESGFSTVLNQVEAVIAITGAIDAAHTEGYSTLAIGNGTHAEGYSTRATGTYSHCEGYHTIASAMRCHAEGRNTEALANDCHTEGIFTTANSACQHVEGKYNIADTQGTYAHIVGNGTTKNNRSNAYTLDWSGNGTYAGNVKANGGSLVLHGANGDVTLTAEILARIIADYST